MSTKLSTSQPPPSAVRRGSLNRRFPWVLKRFLWLIGLIILQLALPTAHAASDPGLPGPLAVLGRDYGGFNNRITLPTSGGAPIEFLGRVWHPATMTTSYPLILMLHGRHATCYASTQPQLIFPCAAPYSNNIPNYTGYDYLAKHLASHGYIVVSISANGVNALPETRDIYFNGQVRAELIQKHLDLWRSYNNGLDPWNGLFRGRVNLSKVGTLGHSRGGEGVVRHYNYNKSLGTPYGVQAVLPLAPTNFARHQINGTSLAVLLPYCDGDVSDLQGIRYFDDSRYNVSADNAAKHTILVMGANHNRYNTTWTDGTTNPAGFGGMDDWLNIPNGDRDSQCGRYAPTRLNAAQQRGTALAYVSAFFQVYLGQRSEFAPYLKGEIPPPPSAQTSQIHLSYHPGASQRRTVNATLTGTQLTTNTLGGLVQISNLSTFLMCGGQQRCLPSNQPYPREPHGWFSSWNGLQAGINQTAIGWNSAGGFYYNAIPASYGNITGFSSVQFRAGVNFTDTRNSGKPYQDFKVWIGDAFGRWAAASVSGYSRVLFLPPGDPSLPGNVVPKLTANTVRIPLTAFTNIDKTNVRWVVFGFDNQAQGSVTVTDLAFSK